MTRPAHSSAAQRATLSERSKFGEIVDRRFNTISRARKPLTGIKPGKLQASSAPYGSLPLFGVPACRFLSAGCMFARKNQVVASWSRTLLLSILFASGPGLPHGPVSSTPVWARTMEAAGSKHINCHLGLTSAIFPPCSLALRWTVHFKSLSDAYEYGASGLHRAAPVVGPCGFGTTLLYLR